MGLLPVGFPLPMISCLACGTVGASWPFLLPLAAVLWLPGGLAGLWYLPPQPIQ